ncbi:MAG: hypothetical protein KVP17_003868 [Porospora cf. gigantea B]|uniref:uncharacterized protein n=1 Tax=Porospora cf. gigantea B TaxID=2853592 RepID=UPI00357198FE|nr:MAG: hypothetical protein KVP17_003868 [Porospora cf. gigantea B]
MEDAFEEEEGYCEDGGYEYAAETGSSTCHLPYAESSARFSSVRPSATAKSSTPLRSNGPLPIASSRRRMRRDAPKSEKVRAALHGLKSLLPPGDYNACIVSDSEVEDDVILEVCSCMPECTCDQVDFGVLRPDMDLAKNASCSRILVESHNSVMRGVTQCPKCHGYRTQTPNPKAASQATPQMMQQQMGQQPMAHPMMGPGQTMMGPGQTMMGPGQTMMGPGQMMGQPFGYPMQMPSMPFGQGVFQPQIYGMPQFQQQPMALTPNSLSFHNCQQDTCNGQEAFYM